MDLISAEKYMQRCLELAAEGAGTTAPNPMVGAVLVHEGIIIGEGYHREYGKAHAEVNCIEQAIRNGSSDQLAAATLYVSLEPCSHFGKTPPCTDLIIRHRIPRVVIGCQDTFTKVDGRGVGMLRAAGVEVEVGILEKDCQYMNKRFFTFHRERRPYVILKWAETKDGIIGFPREEMEALPVQPVPRLMITNEYGNRLVHKWRSEEAAILVGTRTASLDDPSLTNRLWPGRSPVRLVVDMNLGLPSTLQLFNGQAHTIVFNTKLHSEEASRDSLQSPFHQPLYWQVTTDVSLVEQILHALYQLNILSVLVEGGAQLLQSFIDAGVWDEARVIRHTELEIGIGLAAPVLGGATLLSSGHYGAEKVFYYARPVTSLIS